LVESADSNYPGPNTHVVHDAHSVLLMEQVASD